MVPHTSVSSHWNLLGCSLARKVPYPRKPLGRGQLRWLVNTRWHKPTGKRTLSCSQECNDAWQYMTAALTTSSHCVSCFKFIFLIWHRAIWSSCTRMGKSQSQSSTSESYCPCIELSSTHKQFWASNRLHFLSAHLHLQAEEMSTSYLSDSLECLALSTSQREAEHLAQNRPQGPPAPYCPIRPKVSVWPHFISAFELLLSLMAQQDTSSITIVYVLLSKPQPGSKSVRVRSSRDLKGVFLATRDTAGLCSLGGDFPRESHMTLFEPFLE